jgi:hypothetical protein
MKTKLVKRRVYTWGGALLQLNSPLGVALFFRKCHKGMKSEDIFVREPVKPKTKTKKGCK